jgi:hypothetical protein
MRLRNQFFTIFMQRHVNPDPLVRGRRQFDVESAAKSHLGHPRFTVARQSDWASFTLGLNLAKSTSLTTRKKVANHSP